jgi:RNA polymerase sigma factor (sigma-70 family)
LQAGPESARTPADLLRRGKISNPLVRLLRQMDDLLTVATENRRISEVIERERRRLLGFIRQRVEDEGDAEDILQDVFYELTEAYRLMRPVEQAGAWLFRVARNRIIDRFRKKRPQAFSQVSGGGGEEESRFEDLLPSPDAGPEAAYARRVLLEELDAALEELPAEQRAVFVAHEIEDRSFKQIAAETGVGVNTLLSRKRYAILHLRRRLQAIYQEFRKT